MRRQAKASSAGSIEGNGQGRGFLRLCTVLAVVVCALAFAAASADAAPLATKIGTASNVLGASAHVTGELDPDGGAIFNFEYSTDGENWVGGPGGFEPGDGFRGVSADLEGLKPSTKYLVRLSAHFFGPGNPVISAPPNIEFETLPVAPASVISIDDASEVGFTTAQARGEVLRPTPANPDPAFDARCSFEYITDAQFTANQGNSAPPFEGATQASCNHDPVRPADGPGVEAVLTGLAPATTYHLRLRATNAGGSDSKEAAATFTTQSPTAPALALEPASAIEFATAHIAGTVDPEGGNVNPVGGPLPIHWELQYSANPGSGWSLGAEGTLEGADAESSSAKEVSADLSNLQNGTEYKYRLVASYGGQVVISPEEGSFETEEVIAPTVEADNATLIIGTSAHFSGHVTPGNDNPFFDSFCKFEYVTDAEFQPHNEQQRLFISATGGTYTLTFISPTSGAFETTAPIAFDATPVTVQSALQALPGVGAGAVSVGGGPGDEKGTHPYTLTFLGSLAATNIAPLTTDGSLLTVTGEQAEAGAHTEAKVTTIKQGNQGFSGAQSIPCEPNPITGTGSIAVSADVPRPANEHEGAIPGLEPRTVYHLRLSAKNLGGTSSDDAANFETGATAPIISATAAHEIATTTATLNAQVNPRGAATTYHFEYLTLEEFEAAGESFAGATQTGSESIGSGIQGLPVGAPLEGLSPDTAYRFRIVTSNEKSPGGVTGPVASFRTESSAPDSCSNAEVRTQQGSAYLPDCRAYEQASPVNKNGFSAGASQSGAPYSVGAADGNAILYNTSGPMGTAYRGLQEFTVSYRGADGRWATKSAIPKTEQDRVYAVSHSPYSLLPSSDLSKLAFVGTGSYVKDNPTAGQGANSGGMYMGNTDGSVEWLSRPLIPDSEPAPGNIPNYSYFQPVGATPDLSTVYFWAQPNLLPSDEARVKSGLGGGGLYEYTNGVLKSAGTLPNGSESPGGARPASTAANSTWNYNDPETVQNQVSRDGSTLFFVSPEAGDPRELYVRRNGHSTLVSHAVDGSAASSGVVPVRTANTLTSAGSYAYGSVDGKAAIFWSVDSLAPGAPADSMAKAYRYDVETDTVTYLPGIGGRINVGHPVTASIAAASDDDRRFLFTEDIGDSTYFEGIYVWDEGTIKTIYSGLIKHLAPARATASGSVFVFSTSTFDQFLGFNSGPPFTNQIYRYDVATEKLACISCPPDDIVPSGNAVLSNQDASDAGVANPTGSVAPSRGLSEDGNHVFFDTPDPLVPRDTNGTRDVYEWTPTRISLISSGHDSHPSFFLDSSADGSDVFFATQEGLDADDVDGSYDVYDAHVDGGFLRREVTPCSGEECRSNATAPAGAQTAASKSFAGAGNQPQQKPKKKTHKKKHHKKKAHKRNAGHNRGGSK